VAAASRAVVAAHQNITSLVVALGFRGGRTKLFEAATKQSNTMLTW
jgi:hypothetical protein